jgi:hypothetical protein
MLVVYIEMALSQTGREVTPKIFYSIKTMRTLSKIIRIN